MLELEREGGILDRLLDRLSQRRTFILEEPIVKSLRSRRGFEVIEFQVRLPPGVSEEEAKAFMRMWARRLAEGWAERFGPPMKPEDREAWIESMTEELIRSAASGVRAVIPPEVRTPPRRRRARARPVEITAV
jgi:hypothetical protein